MSTTDEVLITNIEEQLGRVMVQLSDLERERNTLDPEEYADMKTDSLEQLKELEKTLDKMQCGDITLTDKLTATKLAIRAAISKAFKTPEVAAAFAKKEPALLRQKLMQVETKYRLHKIEKELYEVSKLEILSALSKLDGKLTDEEQCFLDKVRSAPLSKFQTVSADLSCKEAVVNDMLR